MATKKQKRERGEQKHKEFMAEIRRTGLEAQRKDREYRAKQQRKAEKSQEDSKSSNQKHTNATTRKKETI